LPPADPLQEPVTGELPPTIHPQTAPVVTEAFLWGAFASGSLLLGAVVAALRPPGKRLLGLVMGFGAGVLISAVAFELMEEAVDVGGPGGATVGLFAGAAVFTVGDILIGRFERRRRHSMGEVMEAPSGLSIVLGALLDGVPETAVLGLTILQTGEVGFAMLMAVFVSNIPEGVAATTTLEQHGWRRSRILWMWTGIVAVCALSAAVGYAVLDGAAPATLAFTYAFAAGAILTMLATSMMPEAYEDAGRPVGFVTVVGFAVAFGLSVLEATG
jgi:ZIP family zinc transporter